MERMTSEKGFTRTHTASTRVIPVALKDNFSSLALQFSSLPFTKDASSQLE